MDRIPTVSNVAAQADSYAPETVAAWSDHFLIQSQNPTGRWQCDKVATNKHEADYKARNVSAERRPVRIVKPVTFKPSHT